MKSESLFLSYTPPYDRAAILSFFAAHIVPGTEVVTAESYARTVACGGRAGWISVRQDEGRHGLLLSYDPALKDVRDTVVARVRNLFDLDTAPENASAHLSQDALLAPSLALRPGLRVPGAFDAFDLATRAILGQQVSVKAATVTAGKFAAAFGRPIDTPIAGLSRLPPSAEDIAAVDWEEIAKVGIIGARARCIAALAQGIVEGRMTLDPDADPKTVEAQLLAVKGIGPWTAHYIAMRALKNPDCFPKEDIAVRKMLGGVTAKEAEARSQAWRPWRSYATMHLWAEYMNNSVIARKQR